MRTEQVKVFKFSELSEEAKERARAWYREGGLDYEWWDSIYEMFKTGGLLLGININQIYFSGFCSQGDGACFTGEYAYKKGWRAELKKEFGGELLTIFENIGQQLQDTQKQYFYKLSASVAHNGYYYHELCTDINVKLEDSFYPPDTAEREIKDILRQFMQHTYSCLEKEYDYLNSDESVDESIINNDYEFTGEGKIYV